MHGVVEATQNQLWVLSPNGLSDYRRQIFMDHHPQPSTPPSSDVGCRSPLESRLLLPDTFTCPTPISHCDMENWKLGNL